MLNNCSRPSLSFDEFEEKWDEYKISELVAQDIIDKPMDGNHGEMHPKSSDYVPEGIPFVMANDIVDGKINFEKVSKITKTQADSLRKGFSLEGDVLLTHKGTVGNTAIVPHINVDYLMLTPQVTYYRVLDKSKLNNQFLKNIFESFVYKKQLKIAAASGTRPYVGIIEQATIKIKLPEIKEQQKIADFLSAVDKKISLLKEKHVLLEQYKKGVMQKLFSQEIRFKDENGNDFPDWENKIVGDFMVESKVKGSNGLVAKKITVKLWGKGVFEKNENILGSENTRYYKRKSGQFLYSKLDFLNCAFGIIPDFLDDFETTVDLPCFDITNGINKYLILEFIKQKSFYKKYGDMADGSRKAKRIHAKDFLSFPIKLPCTQEQNKISDFLQTLDKKIDLVSQQIEQTQAFKKGLLQQMFV